MYTLIHTLGGDTFHSEKQFRSCDDSGPAGACTSQSFAQKLAKNLKKWQIKRRTKAGQWYLVGDAISQIDDIIIIGALRIYRGIMYD